MKHLIPFLVVLIHYASVGTRCDSTKIFNVVDYGAVGDGHSDDTNAFGKAWEETCAWNLPSVVMQIPRDKTFLIQPSRFNGPCNSNTVTVLIDGNLVAPGDLSEWQQCEGNTCREWIHFYRVDGLRVVGHGTLDGRGGRWWNQYQGTKPTTLQIADSKNIYFGYGLQFKDSPQMHIVLNGLTSVSVSNVTIDAPGESPNTDGIHVAGCRNVVIDHSQIRTGDDCISIVDGSSNVLVSNIICGPGHGISIGSLGKNGAEDKVEYIAVRDVVFIGSQNGARIKTWQGGKGYAQHILFERILYHETTNPIIIDQFYCDKEACVLSELGVQVKNVTFRELLGTSSQQTAVRLLCSASVPCTEIFIDNMHIRTSDDKEPSFECRNVFGRAQGDEVPKLSCFH